MHTLNEQLAVLKTRSSGPLGLFRKKAKEKCDTLGLPTKKWGAFQYMPLLKLYQASFTTREKVAPKYGAIPFHNGCFIPRKLDAVELMTLEEGIKKYTLFISNTLNKSIGREQNPFMLLNLEKHEEGAFLYIPPNVSVTQPLTITQHSETPLSFSKLHILVGKNAFVNLCIEPPVQHEENFSHLSIDCTVEDNGQVTIVSHTEERHTGWYFESVRIQQKRNSKSRYYIEGKGGKGSRYDAEVSLQESGAETEVIGVHELREKAEAHTHILVRHSAPHCISNQKIKCGLFDEARSSFEGKIFVEKEAQKTEAYQINNNLLLGERAKAYSKPNLEIFADDVKASHGSTIGQLSEEELFYLAARGMHKHDAENMLVDAFFQEIYHMRPFVWEDL